MESVQNTYSEILNRKVQQLLYGDTGYISSRFIPLFVCLLRWNLTKLVLLWRRHFEPANAPNRPNPSVPQRILPPREHVRGGRREIRARRRTARSVSADRSLLPATPAAANGEAVHPSLDEPIADRESPSLRFHGSPF